MPDEQEDPWIGRDLADYTILRLMGHGGMGVVYQGRHRSLNRLAAIKFLSGHLAADSAYIEMFLREARAAAHLTHPNIVTVYDSGCVGDDIYYFIMEHIEGRDLAVIQEGVGVLPVTDAVEYARQAASALAYAHKKGIIHRDVKPENLLLTDNGVIKVADLGLAKYQGSQDGAMTQDGVVLGSPFYISPERLKSTDLDARADIYSLGASLYHLVTGKIPYEGSPAMVMAMHLTGPVPNPHEANPGLDKDICDIIRRMMAKDPNDRYQTMEEVEKAFANYLGAPLHVAVAPAQPAPAPIRWPRIAGAAFAALVVVAAGTWFFLKPKKPESTAAQPPPPAQNVVPNIIAKQPPASSVEISVPTEMPADSAKQTVNEDAPRLQPDLPQEEPKPKEEPKIPVSEQAAVNLPNFPTPEASASPIKPLLVTDFDKIGATKLNNLQGPFGAWATTAPEPAGKCVEQIDRGAWRIEYDISKRGAAAGVWMHLQGVDLTQYNTLRFEARSDTLRPVGIVIELKVGLDASRVVRFVKVGPIHKNWRNIEIPLSDFRLPALTPVYEITFGFNEEVTEHPRGILLIDNIEFRRK
jgi:serine/threonine protein kinase